jgi:hypothetical protein
MTRYSYQLSVEMSQIPRLTCHAVWRLLRLEDLRKILFLDIKTRSGEYSQDLDDAVDVVSGGSVSPDDTRFSIELITDRLQTLLNAGLADIAREY